MFPLNDIALLRAALETGRKSQSKGNLPFGCILADIAGNILAYGENTVITDNDAIAHCEINIIHQLAGRYSAGFLSNCTIYAGTEPCPMCMGAIFWSGIGRLVYALSKQGYHEVAGTVDPAYMFQMAPKDLLAHGGRDIEVVGPLLEEEAKQFYKDLLSEIT
jgi:tRNA(Arg) A34 adenosine deaminase TadA